MIFNCKKLNFTILMLLTTSVIIAQENLNTSKLVDAGVYMFAYVYNPVPIVGATGSIGHPTAMW